MVCSNLDLSPRPKFSWMHMALLLSLPNRKDSNAHGRTNGHSLKSLISALQRSRGAYEAALLTKYQRIVRVYWGRRMSRPRPAMFKDFVIFSRTKAEYDLAEMHVAGVLDEVRKSRSLIVGPRKTEVNWIRTFYLLATNSIDGFVVIVENSFGLGG